jgi:hypothetical protein
VKTLRKLLDFLLHMVAVGIMIAILVLTATQAATVQAIVMLLATGLMTLAVSEQVAGRG